MSIFGVVLILLIVIAAWLIWTYNRFIRYKNTVREAFEEDKLVEAENAMGGIARLCYKQMDG